MPIEVIKVGSRLSAPSDADCFFENWITTPITAGSTPITALPDQRNCLTRRQGAKAAYFTV